MEILVLATLLMAGFYLLKAREQSQRIALLGQHLGQHQIEKLMENLTSGYLRALGEEDPERRTQIWSLLPTAEAELCTQFQRFATGFAAVDPALTRVSTLPIAVPGATRLFPAATFDLRKALAIHGHGIAQVAANAAGRSQKDKAFMLTAELFLMQHTCHWYCRSRAVASARLLARHKTSWAQVLAAVSPETRAAYRALTGC
ncbi:MAG: hypothetical protein IAE92_09165 [Burkholderiaceae bacterium]|nr:hypothetical protein [Burkholderiaceae bacterium]